MSHTLGLKFVIISLFITFYTVCNGQTGSTNISSITTPFYIQGLYDTNCYLSFGPGSISFDNYLKTGEYDVFWDCEDGGNLFTYNTDGGRNLRSTHKQYDDPTTTLYAAVQWPYTTNEGYGVYIDETNAKMDYQLKNPFEDLFFNSQGTELWNNGYGITGFEECILQMTSICCTNYSKWTDDSNELKTVMGREAKFDCNLAHKAEIFGQFTLISGTHQINTQFPTGDPTSTHGIYRPPYAGYTLFVRGYNIFKDETSGHPILYMDSNNVEFWSDEGASCSLDSLAFNEHSGSYEEYAASDSESIALGFDLGKYGAGGSLATTRVKTKSQAFEAQIEIYTMELTCVETTAALVSEDELYFTSNFLKALKALPQTFDADDSQLSESLENKLEPYIEFWKTFGTHVMKSAKFGGSIRGAITVNKCMMQESFTDANSYEACLNGKYKGIDVDGCIGESTSSTTGSAVELAIMSKQITVKGGGNSEITNVFNEFADKTNDFQTWIDLLKENPDIVGGHLTAIHAVIKSAIDLGDHRLNYWFMDQNEDLSDEQWLIIAEALEKAFDARSEQLLVEDAKFGEDCMFDCDECVLKSDTCKCESTNGISTCCGGSADRGSRYSVFVASVVVFGLLTW
eukprot:243249_1